MECVIFFCVMVGVFLLGVGGREGCGVFVEVGGDSRFLGEF